jgi:nicotinate-nucleotide adenylyltransferase
MKIAIFGGTFDPIHDAHLSVAGEALAHFGLDKILFIPAAVPPHKKDRDIAGWRHRFRMVELACESNPAFEPSRLEEEQETSYTIHTLERLLKKLGPDDDLFFLMGADAFADIDIWYRKEDVFRLVEFIVVSRPGHQYETPEGAVVHRLESLGMDVSSSEIRDRIRQGDTNVPVPAKVLAYLRNHAIYKPNESAALGS